MPSKLFLAQCVYGTAGGRLLQDQRSGRKATMESHSDAQTPHDWSNRSAESCRMNGRKGKPRYDPVSRWLADAGFALRKWMSSG